MFTLSQASNGLKVEGGVGGGYVNLEDYVTKEELSAEFSTHNADIDAKLENYTTQAQIDIKLTQYITNDGLSKTLSNYPQHTVTQAIQDDLDVAEQRIDSLVSNTYTRTQVDSKLADHTHAVVNIDNKYKFDSDDTKLLVKDASDTTIASYTNADQLWTFNGNISCNDVIVGGEGIGGGSNDIESRLAAIEDKFTEGNLSISSINGFSIPTLAHTQTPPCFVVWHGDGGVEVGSYLDFHLKGQHGKDYSRRFSLLDNGNFYCQDTQITANNLKADNETRLAAAENALASTETRFQNIEVNLDNANAMAHSAYNFSGENDLAIRKLTRRIEALEQSTTLPIGSTFACKSGESPPSGYTWTHLGDVLLESDDPSSHETLSLYRRTE